MRGSDVGSKRQIRIPQSAIQKGQSGPASLGSLGKTPGAQDTGDLHTCKRQSIATVHGRVKHNFARADIRSLTNPRVSSCNARPELADLRVSSCNASPELVNWREPATEMCGVCPMPGPPILIIEDEPAIRDFVAMALSAEGHRVLTASNGAEGLRALERDQPALILLDLRMPVLDGMT